MYFKSNTNKQRCTRERDMYQYVWDSEKRVLLSFIKSEIFDG